MKQRVFAQDGSSFQQIGGECPDGWIEMLSQRPGDFDIAKADGTWLFRAAPAPGEVSGAQGQLALIELGKYHAARAYIAGIADETDRLKAEIEWGRPTWHLDSPFLNSTWLALGGTRAQLEDAFRLAASL